MRGVSDKDGVSNGEALDDREELGDGEALGEGEALGDGEVRGMVAGTEGELKLLSASTHSRFLPDEVGIAWRAVDPDATGLCWMVRPVVTASQGSEPLPTASSNVRFAEGLNSRLGPGLGSGY